MKRIQEKFLETLEQAIGLEDMSVLEVGCGNGARSVEIAKRCKSLTAIEPNEVQLRCAKELEVQNIDFRLGSAEALDFAPESFDVVIFTLSFHHVPQTLMSVAINEALRVVRQNGFIVFLEPAVTGSFFEAEIRFDACDGDEREEKRIAYEAMSSHTGLVPVKELPDETIFQFDSLDDFIQSMCPKANLDQLEPFLRTHHYILRAKRRINIYRPR